MGSRRSTTRHPSSAPIPLYLPHHFRSSPSTSSSLPPLSPSQLAQKSVLQLNSQQFPLNPLSSRFQLAQKCAPTPPQVQNPALKCARPFSGGFKMRAACAPRCANFPKNPIFSPKQRKQRFSTTPPASSPTPRFRRPPAGHCPPQETYSCLFVRDILGRADTHGKA